MKIGWISDYNIDTRKGGAQLTDHFVIQELVKEHEVIQYGLFNVLSSDMMLDCDFYVISNWVNLFKFENARNLLKLITQKGNYIRFIHDYDGTSNTEESHVLYEKLEMLHNIYDNSHANVFLSPLHMKTYCSRYKLIHSDICIPPYIDGDEFQDRKLKRVNRGLALGELAIHKGFYQLYELAQKAQFDIDFYNFNFGSTIDLGYLHLKPPVDYGLVPYLFNIYHEFFHYPQWEEPFGRTIAEAHLSGIRVTCNKENVGFYSYDFNYANKKELAQKLQEGPTLFCELISLLKANM